MRNDSKTIGIGFSGLYRFLMKILEPATSRPDSPAPADHSIAQRLTPEGETGAEQKTKADPYEDMYQYLYMYWFI